MSASDFTHHLGLPYLLSNQAQKHVTLNESLRALDGLLFLGRFAQCDGRLARRRATGI